MIRNCHRGFRLLYFTCVFIIVLLPRFAEASIDLSEQVITTYGWQGIEVIDLNGDGIDEILGYDLSAFIPNINFCNNELRVFSVKNYGGIVDSALAPQAADLAQDGHDDIVFPLVRGDTVIFEVFSGTVDSVIRESRFSLPIPADFDGNGAWDGDYRVCASMDINNDGQNEFLIRVASYCDLQPRGLFVYDPGQDSVLWEFYLGPLIVQNPILVDIHNDSEPEILATSFAPKNGTSVNNIPDDSCYVLLLSHTGQEIWRRAIGGPSTEARAWSPSATDMENHVINILKNRGRDSTESYSICQLDLITGQVLIENKITNPGNELLKIVSCDPRWRERIGFVVAARSGRIWRWDSQLNLLNTHILPQVGMATYIVDIDRDGSPEILTNKLLDGTFRIFNEDFVEIAHISPQPSHSSMRFVSSGNYTPGKLLIGAGGQAIWIQVPQLPIKLAAYVYDFLERRLGMPALKILFRSPLVDWTGLNARHFVWQVLGILSTPFTLTTILIVLLSIRRYRILRLRKYLSELPELFDLAVLGITAKNRIAFMNDSALKILGLESSKWRNRKTQDIFTGSKGLSSIAEYLGLPKAHQHRTRVLIILNGNPQELEIYSSRWMKRKEFRWRLYTLKLISGESPTEVASRWLNEINMILHDLKMPLDRASRHLQKIQHETSNATQQDANSKVRNEIDYCTLMIEKVARLVPETIELTTFRLDLLIKETARELRVTESFSDNTRLICEIDTDCAGASVVIDNGLWLDAMSNLVKNADESYSGEGGPIYLTASVAQDLQRSKMACVAVIDKGCGIEPQVYDHLFSGISTKHPGAGFGMRIAQRNIESFGGTLSIASELKKGTIVTIELPIQKQDSNGIRISS